jgi:uncharacterized membrane protein
MRLDRHTPRKESNMKNALLAAAVTGLMLGSATQAFAGDDANKDKSGKSAKEKHACKGQNACKGQGGCKSEKHACKGHNACKGQGGCKG